MRYLDHGSTGERKFCCLMDRPPPVTQSTHDEIQKNIYTASKAIAEVSMRDAVEEERLRTSLEEGKENIMELVVSGDGTWQKCGFSSLFGICSLIGVHSKKNHRRQREIVLLLTMRSVGKEERHRGVRRVEEKTWRQLPPQSSGFSRKNGSRHRRRNVQKIERTVQREIYRLYR